jgi:hypothetical protein
MSSPVQGDRTYLGSIDALIGVFGVIGNGIDNLVPGSMELADNVIGGQPIVNIVLNAVIGEQGIQGESTDIVNLQYERNLTSASELPSGLTEDDEGLAFWIGNVVFVWSGNDWFGYPLGVPGPPGQYPVFSVAGQLVPSGTLQSLTQPINILHSADGLIPGNAENPSLLFQFDKDSIQGPAGPENGPLRDSIDFDNTVAVGGGDAIIYNALTELFQASPFSQLTIPVYSVPEGSFTSVTNSAGGSITVCTFPIPQQTFEFRPVVLGVIQTEQVGFFNLFESPVNVGCSVKLGDALNGTLIGRGFGTNGGWAYIFPHWSTPSNPYQSISPTSDLGVVPANATGTTATIYITITNDSGLGLSYQFSNTNAQLIVACVPTFPYVPVVGGLNVHLLSGKGRLSATAEGYDGS